MGALVVFAGRPGCGKTAISRLVADRLGAMFLRIDTIEAAIVSTLAPVVDNPVGYVTAARVAADQLRGGRPVMVDAVNDVQRARETWIELAAECDATLHFVEVICSDAAEHRRRVETRTFEMPGHTQPSWAQVQAGTWEPFTRPRLLIDNLGDVDRHVDALLARLRGEG